MNNGSQSGLERRLEILKNRQREELLDEVGQMADREFAILSQEIKNGFEYEKAEIRKDLSEALEEVFQKYKFMEERGETGDLKWIYFSFLRSSMMDDYPAYRIDFYDERDCYSYRECSGSWDFSFVFSRFRKLKEKIRDIFSCQSRVKEYETDDMLYSFYEKFHLMAAELLGQLLQDSWDDYFNIKKPAVIRVKEGELFDRTNIIQEWYLQESGEI